MLSKEAKNYIKQNQYLLEENKFQKFFDKCDWAFKNEIAEFFLLDCDINFLEYMTEISSYLFYNSKRLESINIPDSVTKICKSAFSSCILLQSITISNSVTKIDDYAFYWCTSLQSVTIPDSVIEIGKDAFAYCASLKEIKLPKHLKENGLKLSDIGIQPRKVGTKVIWY